MAQISQTAACNRIHVVETRLARWLLMTHDRVKSDQVRMTHEFLGHMLGVRRVGVTRAAQALQERDLIRYSRGDITVLDRTGLEAAACQCYKVVRDMHAGALAGQGARKIQIPAAAYPLFFCRSECAIGKFTVTVVPPFRAPATSQDPWYV